MISANEEDRRTTTPHTRHYKNEQEPFIEKGDYIKAHAAQIRRRTQVVCKNLMPDCPTAHRGEHQNRVDWASGLRIAVWRGLRKSRSLDSYLTSRIPPFGQQLIGPDWLNFERYEIEAKVPEGATATPAQLQQHVRLTASGRFGESDQIHLAQTRGKLLLYSPGRPFGDDGPEAAIGQYRAFTSSDSTDSRSHFPCVYRAASAGSCSTMREFMIGQVQRAKLMGAAGRA
jgi:hypothetical protein